MVDKISTQVLYAVTGIVLARVLSPADFGLVGAALVFQAFASLLIDSGFSYALLQRQRPTRLDYSTVLWFNIAVSVALYLVLFLCAPLIADWFQNDRRLIAVCRVLFLAMILNAATIVQTSRLTKAMEVRGVALANSLGLLAGGVAGIGLALNGFGVWAIVWQTLAAGAVKAAVLWTASRWRPLMRFSWKALKSFFSFGSSMMLVSLLNTVFLNIYSFFIGNRVGMAPLGYYTQADKWSKMGTASLSQVLTSSFVPALSAVQTDADRFRRLCSKMTRFTAYIVFPAMIWLTVAAEPLFHCLFGAKWDPAILLFRILLIRGIFVVLTSLSNNFLIALGHGKELVKLEILRDSVALGALVATFPYMGMSTADNPVYGLGLLLAGQLLASIVAWVATVVAAVRYSGATILSYLRDLAPYAAMASVMVPMMISVGDHCESPWLCLAVELLSAAGCYLIINKVLKSRIQQEVIGFICSGRFSHADQKADS